MGITALAMTALLAARPPNDWKRVERLRAGDTVRMALGSGAPTEATIAGVDGGRLVVFAAGFRRLPRSTRRDVIDGLAAVRFGAARLLEEEFEVQRGPLIISRDGVVRDGVVSKFDEVFEVIDADTVLWVARDLHPHRHGVAIGALVGVLHGWIAGVDAAAERSSVGDGVASFFLAIALDGGLGYLFSRDRPRFEVIYRQPAPSP